MCELTTDWRTLTTLLLASALLFRHSTLTLLLLVGHDGAMSQITEKITKNHGGALLPKIYSRKFLEGEKLVGACYLSAVAVGCCRLLAPSKASARFSLLADPRRVMFVFQIVFEFAHQRVVADL